MYGNTSSSISSSAYETAAVSMVLDSERLTRWLIASQHYDGSWGGKIPFAADRLLQSMMVVRALLDYKQRSAAHEDLDDAIGSGILYISEGLAHWSDEALTITDLSGYELLVPAHHRALTDAGIALPPIPPSLLERHRRKMGLLPAGAFFHPKWTNLQHSMEALEGQLSPDDVARLEGLLLSDGSLASSPSATTFLLRQQGVSEPGCKRMRSYLEAASNPDGTYSPTFPLDQVTTLWQLYFERMIASDSLLRARLLWTLARLDLDKGVGANALFVADGDDTAVAAALAADFGLEFQALALARVLMRDFYNASSGLFRTYQAELTASPTTCAHAAEALVVLLKHDFGSATERADWQTALISVGNYLREHLWTADKWHASRYYVLLKLTRSLEALVSLREVIVELQPLANEWAYLRTKVRDDLLAQQDRSGGWGAWGQPTVEETAYATLTLLQLRSNDNAWCDALAHSREFLNTSGGRSLTEMWIDKTLYQPDSIIASAVQAAQGLLWQELGDSYQTTTSLLKRPPRG